MTYGWYQIVNKRYRTNLAIEGQNSKAGEKKRYFDITFKAKIHFKEPKLLLLMIQHPTGNVGK